MRKMKPDAAAERLADGQDRARRRHPHEARSAPGQRHPQRNGQQGRRDASPASWPARAARKIRHDPHRCSSCSRSRALAGCGSTAFREIGCRRRCRRSALASRPSGRSIYNYPRAAGRAGQEILAVGRPPEPAVHRSPRIRGRRHPDRADLDQRRAKLKNEPRSATARQAHARARLARSMSMAPDPSGQGRRRHLARTPIRKGSGDDRRARKTSSCRSPPSSPRCCRTAI